MTSSSNNTERPIDTITVGKRHRRDMGDLRSLAATIEQLGLLHPVVVKPDGRLIAGERRLRACEALGWKTIPVRVLDVQSIVRAEAAENFERQDFTPSEAVAIKRTLEPEMKAEAERRMRSGKPLGKLPEGGRAADKAAQVTGYSRRTLDKAEAIVEAAEAEPDKYAKLQADMDRIGRVDAVHRRLVAMQQGERIRAEPPPLPRGRYRVVTIDPPWPYDVREDDPSHLSATPYPQMSVADISALPIPALLHEDAALWLWVTNCHLLEGAAHAVLAAWGLMPRTMMTWTKNHMRRGYWLRNQTEHCILATRGRPTITLTNQTTALIADVGHHSEKPAAFYALVESLCPAPRYLELFARKARPGWTVWGDEVPSPSIARSEAAE
jgi:N6-adenosine-specific RNA methylase IME4/ParB-like chromosome segregation protein Spo0J